MENSPQSTIQKNVMQRVHIIHTTRSVFRAELLAAAVMVLALYGVGREVWVARVFQNMPSLTNVSAFSQFWLTAFIDTRLIVQVLVATTLLAGIYLARECARLIVGLSSTRQTA